MVEYIDVKIQKLHVCYKCSGRISYFRFKVVSGSREECFKRANTLLNNRMFKNLGVSYD